MRSRTLRTGKHLFWALVLAALLQAPATPAAVATDVERVVSPGGVEAWLVEEHSIPLIATEFAFRGGSALDPPGKEGLAAMVSYLLDEGADDLDAQAFQERLADLAIRMSFEAGLDVFRGTLQTLTENRDTAFSLLKLALTEPSFDEDAVERIRQQMLVDRARAAEDPGEMAERTWFATAFPDHPYGRDPRGTTESLKRIGVEDLRAFVGRRLARDNLVIGVVGDIAAEELALLLDQTFGALPAAAAPVAIPEARPAGQGRTLVVRKEIPQSVVAFGKEGIKRGDPDFYAAYVLNYVLGGGGFSSRLTEELREKRGLAYSVYSYLYPLDHAGLYLGGVATRNERVAESIELIRGEFGRLYRDGVTKAELAAAKTYLTGSFPLRLDSNRRIAGLLVSMRLDELGIDYIDRRNGYVEAVERADVDRVARRLASPDGLTFVVVGEPEGVEPTP